MTASEDPFLDPSSDTGISGSDIDEDQSYLGYMYSNKHMEDYFSISSSPASVTHVKEEFMGPCDVSSVSSSGSASPPLFSSSIVKKSNSINVDLGYQQNHDNVVDLDSYLVTSVTTNRQSTEKDPNLACQNTTLKRTRIQRFDKHRRYSYPHCRNNSNNNASVDKISLTSANANRSKEFLPSSTQQQSILDKSSVKISAIDSNYSLSVPSSTYQSIPYLDPVLSSGSVGDATSDSLIMSDDDISNEMEKSSIDTLLYPSNAEEEAIMNSGYDPYITYGQLKVNSNVMHNPEEVDLSSW